MKAELKHLHSPDADLEKGPAPSDALFVQLMIGPADSPGEESFDLMVCTPEARDSVVDPSDPDSSRYLLVLERIDPVLIKRYVEDFLKDIERPTWQELALAIGQLARWEFHEYRP
ncbi:Imm8 family immunity protein [Nocardia suismassiliense]|uniref:Imm8 family immunity protein n=1 Tax=Nocardia suismassiliense TaxID=2077092 RepID=A0ABW6QUT5_9NOCA